MTQKTKLYYSNDSLLFTNVVCLRGTTNEELMSGIVTIDLEHCPPATLNYLNIKYNDSELEKLVERNNLLRRIDSRIRNELLK